MATATPPINDRKEIFGWAMYDWANSAFSTTIGTVFLGPYVASLARTVAETAGTKTVSLFGIPVAPDSVIPFAIAFSVVFQAGFLPILGAIADYSNRRKQMLQLFATIGALTTIAMFFVTINTWWLGPLLFIFANLAFGSALVFYNAYLPDIASEEERDRVSSYGWAMGYLGGFILLALNLVLFLLHDTFGISESLSIRINLASAGVWWLGFSTVTWNRLQMRRAARTLPEDENILSIAFKQLSETMETPASTIAYLLLSPLVIFIWAPLVAPFVLQLLTVQQWSVDLAILPILVPPMLGPVIMLIIFLRRKARTLPETSKYLTSYLIYNDGIQTVIAVASTFAAAPILNGGLELDDTILIGVILMIQFVAFLGALFWGRLANWIGAKRSIIVSLVIWTVVVIYAYGGMKGDSRVIEFIILGFFIAVVLGGSQAISRSLFAQMVPKSKEAEFFSIYEISERGTSWLGPMIFGIANQVFGNLRIAILALMVFFILGLALLPFVNEKKAIEDVKRFDLANS
ncbi:MAG TPA: MFS transporter [Anaerolineales bacterium]|nr:MFS transporter [Anaerolineales bacterium]